MMIKKAENYLTGCDNLKKIIDKLTVFNTGALGYGLIEVLWRGYTHPSMLVAGGVVFLAFSYLNKFLSKVRMLYKCIIGSGIITVTELIFGLFFNVLLKKDVWSYSNIKFNFHGQICLLYSVLWGFLSIFVCKISSKMNKMLS